MEKPVLYSAVAQVKHVCQSQEQETKQEHIMKVRKRTEFGQYIVADPDICHGQLTFKGTRIMVKSVLFYVAQGQDWEWISQEYYGKVSREAIAEAVNLNRTTGHSYTQAASCEISSGAVCAARSTWIAAVTSGV